MTKEGVSSGQIAVNACELEGLGIHLKVRDVHKSREFYKSLGFQPLVVFGDEAFCRSVPEAVRSVIDNVRGVIFKIGDNAELEIADGHVAVTDREVFQERISSPKVSAMVRVKSLVPLFTNPLVHIKFPVRHYYWRAIEAVFRDPDGFVLVFITPYSEEEFRRVSQFTEIEVINRDSG